MITLIIFKLSILGELPRPEGQGFQRLAWALRLQPHLLVRGLTSLPIPQSPLPCGLCLCLHLDPCEAKKLFLHPPRHPRREK